MSQPAASYSPSLCETFNHFKCHLAETFWLVFSPVLLTIGTLGNILSICVLLQKRMRQSSASIYLIALALADTGVLYIGLLREWLVHLVDSDYRKENDVSCRLQLWLQFSAFASSVWILTSFTVDRHISILWPLFSKTHCSRKLQIVLVCIIPLVAMVTGSHYFLMEQKVTYKWSNVTNTSNIYIVKCVPQPGYHVKFYFKVWPWITIFACSLVPVAVIFISNVRILKVMLSRRKRIAPQTSRIEENRAQSQVNRAVVRMLIAVSIFYIFSTLPICIYLLLEAYLFPVETPENVVNRKLFWAITSLLFYSNSSVNFLLYCFSGTLFRSLFKDMIKNCLQYLLRKLTENDNNRVEVSTASTHVNGSSSNKAHSGVPSTSGPQRRDLEASQPIGIQVAKAVQNVTDLQT